MGVCYTKEAYDQLLGRLEEQQKINLAIVTGNAALQEEVDRLRSKLETKSQIIQKLESSLLEAKEINIAVRNDCEERIKQLEWNFNETISKLCDMQIAELTKTRNNSSSGLNTKTSATRNSSVKTVKKSRLPSLRNLFAKKHSSDTQVSELRKKVQILEMDQKRQLHRKENELTEKQLETKNLESKLKLLERSNQELQNAIPTPCAICFDNINDCTFIPCGHLCTCMKCGTQVSACPLCRADISSRVKVFVN